MGAKHLLALLSQYTFFPFIFQVAELHFYFMGPHNPVHLVLEGEAFSCPQHKDKNITYA